MKYEWNNNLTSRSLVQEERVKDLFGGYPQGNLQKSNRRGFFESYR